MKQELANRRRAAALLLAAAALPLAPAFAQETQVPAPSVDTAPPATEPAPEAQAQVPVPAPAPTPTMEPVVNTKASGNEPAGSERSIEPAPVTRAAARQPAPIRAARAPASRSAAAPVTAAPPPVVASTAEAPAALPPAPVAMPAADAPNAPAASAAPAAPAPANRNAESGTIIPWLVGGLLVIGALAVLLLRRRRRDEDEILYSSDQAYEVAAEPAVEAPLVAGTAVAAVPAEEGRPMLDLAVEPVRAGVSGDKAIVEFALTVDNEGSAAARDVRISTWMFPAGTADSEMERMLIKGPGAATLPKVDAGDAQRIESAVALPTAGLETDSVLPVVVAEARYRLPDGSEGRTSAAFAVGVPWDGELAHFDVENPSGLHEGVEARSLGEAERV